MIRRTARILLEIAGIAAGGALAIAGVLAWRLSSAPVEAGFVRPYLEQEINRAGLGFTVSIAEAKVAWRRSRPSIDLNIHGVEVKGAGGAPIAALEDATLGISLRGLLFGRLLPTELDIRHPEITAVRDEEDHFSLRIGEAAPGAMGDPQALLKRFVAPSDDDPIAGLRRIHIADGRVAIDDRKLGIAWSAAELDVDINRDATATDARITMSLALPQSVARVTGDAKYVGAEGHTHLSFSVNNFDAASVAPLAKMLSPLSALALPVDGRVNAILDRAANLVGGDISLHGHDGRLVLPDYYVDPLAIKSADIQAHFEPSPQRLLLDQLALDFGDARLKAHGTASFDGPAVTIDAQADVANVPLARFDALWPRAVVAGGRDWVTANIPSGILKSGTVHVSTAGRVDDPGSFQMAAFTGGFDYDGLEVHYFGPLQPVRNIAGHATFNSRRMDLTIDSGALGNIAVSQGVLGVTGLDQSAQAIDIGLTIDGPLATVLSVLDTKPLLYAQKLGLEPKAIGGHLNARANFSLPLIKALTFTQVALGAKGTLDGVAVPGVIGGRDVTDGALAVTLDKKGMVLTGGASLSGVPVDVDWHESFEDSDRIHSRIGFRGNLDDADRTALRLDVGNLAVLHGKIAVSGQVAMDRTRGTTLDVSADLGAADLAIDDLGLHKPAGMAATANASLIFAGDTLRELPKLEVQSDGVNFAGKISFTETGTLDHLELLHVGGGRNDYTLSADGVAGTSPGFAVSIKGSRFDAAPLLQRGSTASAPQSRSPRLDLSVAVDHFLTDSAHELGSVAGTAAMTGSRLDRANFKAVASGGPATLVYEPAGNSIALKVDAADAGAFLADLGITRGVRGGTLHIDGKTDGGERPRLTRGSIDMRNFRLIDAPIIARLVSALSLTGFVDLLSGQGLAFDRLGGEMDYGGGKVTFRDGRIAGALGISFEGDVDLDRNNIALKGTVVPVDTLNRIIAAIPVIGGLLGGDRGGLIGWTYTVSGQPDDPHVAVNPLSVFVPGFLRNLFFLGPAEPAPKPEQPPPAEPAPPVEPPPRPRRRVSLLR